MACNQVAYSTKFANSCQNHRAKCTFEEGVRAAQNATTTKQLSGAFEGGGGGGGGGGTVALRYAALRRGDRGHDVEQATQGKERPFFRKKKTKRADQGHHRCCTSIF